MTAIFSELFSFDNVSDDPRAQPLAQLPAPLDNDIHRALAAADGAAYRWTIASDEIAWSDNAAAVLGCKLDQIQSGKLFASLLDVDNFTTRYEAVMSSKLRDDGNGVPYHIEYLFRSEGRNNAKTVWIEDQGRWHAGPDGSPREAIGTIRQIDERHSRDQHLNFLGNCDPLTGMMNRGRMTEALGEAISVAIREKRNCAFAIAAVNNLPVVNEAYGFDVADEVIVALGRRLRQVMRSGDGIARYSGGKFGVILNECSEAELHTALERFLSAVRDSVIETQHGPVWAMLSIGAICLPTNATDANTATARAEEALNEARRQPSDGYVIYKPSERRSSERALNARCATEIVQCLKEDRFKLAFQPIVSAKTGDVAMHEALLRMSDSTNGELIAASHLIPISEHLGLVRLIDRSVMQMIVKTLNAFPQSNLSMNVSGTTAMDTRWYSQLIEILSSNEGVANRLTVEITETVALSDVPSTRQFVENLRTLGCGVAIDDFGAGFTSFRNLRDLPVNMIKLDGSFCQNLGANSENEYIVRNLIDLARKFKIQTVAEWIENQADADALRDWGIDLLQGNLFGEASINPPWQLADNTVFSLENRSSNALSINSPESFVAADVIEQAVSELSVENPEGGSLSYEQELNSTQAEPQIDHSEEAEISSSEKPESDILGNIATIVQALDFSDIDSSITNLRSTLDELRGYFPTEVEPQNRDAA